MASGVVSRIVIYPIKSLDGISMRAATILPSGALEHDREFALFDAEGRWMNGKRDARLNSVRSEFDLEALTVRLSAPERGWQAFHFIEQQRDLDEWFSSLLDLPVHVKRDQHSGFPDDTHAQGPTIISTGTIMELSAWFELSDHDETRRRFRANIELSFDTPFWEDRLFGKRGSDIRFLLGSAELFGVGPCKRCVVPTRDSITGAITPDFQKLFEAKRLANLPEWVNRARFGPLFYRVAVNTRVNSSEAGKQITVGDVVLLQEG